MKKMKTSQPDGNQTCPLLGLITVRGGLSTHGACGKLKE